MPVYQRQPQGPASQSILDALPKWLADAISEPSIGDVMPGPMGVMGKGEGPLLKLIAKVKSIIAPELRVPANMGDYLLREHLTLEDAKSLLESPGMREFLPVGGEGGAISMSKGAQTVDPIEKAYQSILGEGGKPIPSPKGSGGGIKHDQPANVRWPSFDDVDELRNRLLGPSKPDPTNPRRRKIPMSKRPLDGK
jgi:hypothetical protein